MKVKKAASNELPTTGLAVLVAAGFGIVGGVLSAVTSTPQAAHADPAIDPYQPYVANAVTNCPDANYYAKPGVVEFRA
jgi:hypothetical protein